MKTRNSQKDLNFWLASYVQRGCDHTPEWVTVSKLLRLGADPRVSPMGIHGRPLPSAIDTCQEMVEAYDPDHGRMLEGWNCSPAQAREHCAKTQAHFQGYLDQFAKAGFEIPPTPRWMKSHARWCKNCNEHISDCNCPTEEGWN
jgi:hypothetical protein